MKILRVPFLLAALVAAGTAFSQTPEPREPIAPLPLTPMPNGVEVEFSSDGADLVGWIVDIIGLAQREVLVSQYAITDLRVLQALNMAFQRGVMVAVLLDRSPAIKNYDTPRYLRGQGIPVIAARRGKDGTGWHNQRYLVIDREAVVLSSCDLTGTAAKNNENLIVLHLPSVAARYYNNWIAEASAGTRLP